MIAEFIGCVVRIRYNHILEKAMAQINTRLHKLWAFLMNNKSLPQAIEKGVRKYRLEWIGSSKMASEHLASFTATFCQIIEKKASNSSRSDGAEEYWALGEQKIFIMVVICYCQANYVDANEMVLFLLYRPIINSKRFILFSPIRRRLSSAMNISIFLEPPPPFGIIGLPKK